MRVRINWRSFLGGLTLRNPPVTNTVTEWLHKISLMALLKSKQREAVFRAIADPTRREILGLLRLRKHTVNELAGNFRTSRPAISKHLRLLRRVGLVVTKNEGTARICQLNAEPLRVVDDWLREYQEFWAHSLQRLKRYVEED